jgi:hypothetical protein
MISPSFSLYLVPLFLVMRIIEYYSKKRKISNSKGSIYAKGLSYFGLGIVILLGIKYNIKDDLISSYYVVTMCFIECVDLIFDFIEKK